MEDAGARFSLSQGFARDNKRERGEKGEKSSYGKREREGEGEVEIGRREGRRGNERRVKHRETEFGVLFITSELTSTTMRAFVPCIAILGSLSLSLSVSNTYAHAAKRILLLFFRKVFT